MLCSHHHDPFAELLSSSRTGTPSPRNTNCPSPTPFLHSLATAVLLSVSGKLATLGTSHGKNYTYSLRDWLISLRITSSRFMHLAVCGSMPFLRILLLLPRTHAPSSVYPFIRQCMVGVRLPSRDCASCCYEHRHTRTSWTEMYNELIQESVKE